MPTDKILHHEDTQQAPYIGFLRAFWKPGLLGKFPEPPFAQKQVLAFINQGRWVVECPAKCGGAVLASQKDPYFVCIDCGSPENGGQFYGVVFPANKALIEVELLKRPARRPDLAFTRNWIPGETVADLQRENQERGIR